MYAYLYFCYRIGLHLVASIRVVGDSGSEGISLALRLTIVFREDEAMLAKYRIVILLLRSYGSIYHAFAVWQCSGFCLCRRLSGPPMSELVRHFRLPRAHVLLPRRRQSPWNFRTAGATATLILGSVNVHMDTSAM